MQTGHHIAGWRHPGAQADAGVNFGHYAALAQKAEAAKFDAVFLADGVAVRSDNDQALARIARSDQFEPLTLLSALAAVTQRIGLIATASTSYHEPYNLARKFASLDQISGGRAGWNLVTSATTAEALNFNRSAQDAHGDRYRRAAEFHDVVVGLWDSWEDDAFIGDKATGRFVDLAKVHPVRHRGEFFSVQGPLNLPRSPQGRPVLVQAGASADGRELAARHAEAVFSASQSFEESLDYARGLKQRAEALGRGPDAVKVLAGLTTIVGSTEAEARRRRDQLVDLIPWSYSLTRLAGTLGVPVDRLKLDERLPEDLALPGGGNGNHTFFHATLAHARRGQFTVRQLIRELAGGGGHRVIVGTPEQIADDIEHWFRAGAADGFNLMPDQLPGGLQDFVDGVVPILQRRGIFRTAYEGRTLREHLGLARPAGREATRRAA